MDFEKLLDAGADFIKQHDTFQLVSHTDADGVCAAAIMQRLLDELGKEYTMHWIEQISTLALERLATSETIVFLDMGSSHLEKIDELFTGNVLILDHHKVEQKTKHTFVNPNSVGLDGSRDICASSIAYEIAIRLMDATPLSTIALIGAQADHQEPFQSYNATILDKSIERRQISVRTGAKLFGVQSKPLVPLVAYSYDLKITGVTGSEEGAEKLLEELDLADKRYFGQLSQEEIQLLDETLINRSKNPEATITFYTLEGMPRGPLRDTREAASLMNACGRLGKPDLAVEVLLTRDARKASTAHRDYRQTIRTARQWYDENEHEQKDNFLLLRAGDHIKASVAGSLCSLLVRGKDVPEGTVVVCLAEYGDGTTKVSGRTSGGTDLSVLMKKAAAAVGGEGGGHDCAAGAIIPTEKEEEFIAALF